MHGVQIRLAQFLLIMALGSALGWAKEKTHGAETETASPQLTAERMDLAGLEALRAQIDAIRAEYEKRIKELETQVAQLQSQMLQVAAEAETPAQPAQPAAVQSVQSIPGALNPAISVVSNFIGRGDDRKLFDEEGNRIDNKLNLREAEVDMRVPVDPYADAVLITSLESESPGHFSADLEEGYVSIKKLPFLHRNPLGLKLKVGRFRPSFGKTNILHTHDLPQSFRPLPVEEFLGPEGFIQNGISTNFFIPTPWDENSTLDVTLEALNGGAVAISPDSQSRGSYLAHLRWFRTVRATHNLELGWSSYFRPSGDETASVNFHGFDFTYRWKPFRLGEWKSYILGGELLFARRSYPEASEPADIQQAIESLEPGHGRPLGYTLFTQWQFDRRKYLGARWDQTDILFSPGLKRRSITPYFSYYFSEFLRFRVNYEHRWSDLPTEDKRSSVYLELNWVFGAHPPEPFWVSK